jgi:transposase
MSLQDAPLDHVPAETARVAHAAFPKGTLAMRVRDVLGGIYSNEDFADLFRARGRPAAAPWRLALVTILQFIDGLSDRQAAEAVRSRIDWKYLLGLELTDPGFDFSILSEFRARLLAGEAEQRLLDRLLAVLQDQRLLQARGRQRTDSTHVLAAVRVLNRLVLVGETLRHALNSLAVAAPDWLPAQVAPEWFDRYGLRVEEGRLPAAAAARQALAEAIGADGRHLLTAVRAADAPAWLREVPAVEVLRQVWLQQYHAPAADGRVRWRERGDQPPSSLAIASPYDAEARFSTKRRTSWVGTKVHVTETCDPGQPHLITHVETTPATTDDGQVVDTIHARLAAKQLLPGEHLLDAGYVDTALLLSSQAEHGVALVGPVRTDHSWQAKAGQGFDAASFVIDWEAQRVECPRGATSADWQPGQDPRGNAVIRVKFARAACAACPSRSDCTRAAGAGRELTLRPQEHQAALEDARQRQTTADFAARYAARAGVEGTLSQGVRAFGLRRARYLGLARTHLQHVITAVAIDLVRVEAWLTGQPCASTRRSRFAALAPAGVS